MPRSRPPTVIVLMTRSVAVLMTLIVPSRSLLTYASGARRWAMADATMSKITAAAPINFRQTTAHGAWHRASDLSGCRFTSSFISANASSQRRRASRALLFLRDDRDDTRRFQHRVFDLFHTLQPLQF